MREEGSGTRKEIKKFLNHMKINDGSLNIIATLNSTEAIKRSVANNMGTSIISNLAVQDYIKDKRKYKIRKYIINRGNRDINNDIKHISDKLNLGLLRL